MPSQSKFRSVQADTTGRLRVQRERLGDLVYGKVLEQILAGQFAVGDRLPTETEFADMFSVSRPVIREAMQRLQSDGVVLTRQGAGTYVHRKPPRRLIEVIQSSKVADVLRCIEARMAVEGATAHFAAQRRTDADVLRLQTSIENLRRDFEAGIINPEVDFTFHQNIAEASGNRHLLGAFDFLTKNIKANMSVTLGITRKGSKERAQRVVDEHERIIDAILDSDGDSASLAMRYHLDQARKRLMDGSRDY
jgi:DNA-binding FadR family transcriptional regulator